MKITVETDGQVLVAEQPYEGADHIIVSSLTKCPACGEKFDDGLPVVGSGKNIAGHDTYRATAHGKCCGRVIGVIRVKVSTIFGIEEDEAVLLRSRCRVY